MIQAIDQIREDENLVHIKVDDRMLMYLYAYEEAFVCDVVEAIMFLPDLDKERILKMLRAYGSVTSKTDDGGPM